MMKYIYIITGIILAILAWNGDWFFRGNEAIAAVGQVGEYYEYAHSRLMMLFWDRVFTGVKIASIILIGGGLIKFYIEKQNDKENENE